MWRELRSVETTIKRVSEHRRIDDVNDASSNPEAPIKTLWRVDWTRKQSRAAGLSEPIEGSESTD